MSPDEQKIEDFIKELQNDGMSLTCEDDAFHFLGVEVVHHDDGKVELLQKGLISKVLKTMGMENAHTKRTPASNVPLGTNADGEPFVENWSYPSVVRILLSLSSNLDGFHHEHLVLVLSAQYMEENLCHYFIKDHSSILVAHFSSLYTL